MKREFFDFSNLGPQEIQIKLKKLVDSGIENDAVKIQLDQHSGDTFNLHAAIVYTMVKGDTMVEANVENWKAFINNEIQAGTLKIATNRNLGMERPLVVSNAIIRVLDKLSHNDFINSKYDVLKNILKCSIPQEIEQASERQKAKSVKEVLRCAILHNDNEIVQFLANKPEHLLPLLTYTTGDELSVLKIAIKFARPEIVKLILAAKGVCENYHKKFFTEELLTKYAAAIGLKDGDWKEYYADIIEADTYNTLEAVIPHLGGDGMEFNEIATKLGNDDIKQKYYLLTGWHVEPVEKPLSYGVLPEFALLSLGAIVSSAVCFSLQKANFPQIINNNIADKILMGSISGLAGSITILVGCLVIDKQNYFYNHDIIEGAIIVVMPFLITSAAITIAKFVEEKMTESWQNIAVNVSAAVVAVCLSMIHPLLEKEF